MKSIWPKLAGRINAMSLRERALIFGSVLIGAAVMADQFWLAPAQFRQRQVAAGIKQQSTELQALRSQLASRSTMPTVENPTQAVRSEINELRSRLEVVNREIAHLSQMGGEVDPLPGVLVHILRRYEGLTLERTVTLDPEMARSGQVGAEAAAAIKRQAMEFTVSGSYAELMRYVQTLEQELPNLRWGTMTLSSGKTASPQLTLQVFWLGVAS